MGLNLDDQDIQIINYEVSKCLMEEYKPSVIQILKNTEKLASYGIVVSFASLNFSCPRTFDCLLTKPELVFQEADKAAIIAQRQVYDEERHLHENLSLKTNLRVRLKADSLNIQSPLYKHQFPDCEAIGQYIVLAGTVVQTQSLRSLPFQKPYRCITCKRITNYQSPASRFHKYPTKIELKCETCDTKTKFKPLSPNEVTRLSVNADFKDYQEIKISEKLMGYECAVNTKVYTVILEEDLTNSCIPGDHVYVGGWLFCRFEEFKVGVKIKGELVFKANHVAVTNVDLSQCLPTAKDIQDFKFFWNIHELNPLFGRDLIVKSFCPQLCNMFPVKLASLVAIIGGAKSKSDETKTRKESHILLVGDPAIGKSQLLKYCSKLIPRSVLTTGYGSTAAGLTVSATRVGGESEMQAGALVLAGSGLCCIDEFNLLPQRERNSILEGMEQQTISVSKGGMITNINIKCTVMAAANPKLKVADNKVDVDVAISSPLLSRFDVVMQMLDERNLEWDKKFADFILNFAQNNMSECPVWDTEKLRVYIGHVKKFDAEICNDAKEVLAEYYNYQRQIQGRSVIVTPRFIESLRRLTEGHCRLMFRKKALVMDAIVAILIMEYSLYSSNLLGLPFNSVTQVPFPKDSLEDYKKIAKKVLKGLKLESTWVKEEQFLSKLTSGGVLQNDCGPSTTSTEGNDINMETDDQQRSDWFRNDLSQDSGGQIRLISSTSIEVVQASFPKSSSDLSVIEPPSQDPSQDL